VAENLDCLPLQWPAYAQYLDEAGVDWRSYQESYNWATNSGLFYFEAFQEAAVNSSLYQRGLAFDGDNSLASFKAAAANGTLPEVSWVFPPGALQEHPPNTPKDASWFMNQVVSAAINGPNYNETVILESNMDAQRPAAGVTLSILWFPPRGRLENGSKTRMESWVTLFPVQVSLYTQCSWY
jgi:phospholipase C